MNSSLEELQSSWSSHWEGALAHWSRYTRLSAPHWCCNEEDERREGLVSSFAMIRLDDHAVVISLRQIAEQGLHAFPEEVLAHEIGHHVYCPGDLTDHARLLARIRAGLPGQEASAPFIANLYADLMINNRLQRSVGLNMVEVYQALAIGSADALWDLYMRIYEILWSLPRVTLTSSVVNERIEGDAQLGARLIRAYQNRWMEGAGRFACLCFHYVEHRQYEETLRRLGGWLDTETAGLGGDPSGLAEIEEGEFVGAIHPALDRELNGGIETSDDCRELPGGQKKTGQYREIAEYGQLLEALGIKLSEQELAMRYYRERALPHLIRFPSRQSIVSTEPLPEGLEEWDIGMPLAQADWLESVLRSPVIVPGMTTVQRTYGQVTGDLSRPEPVDLYIGIDCSGSMPNPRQQLSFPALAGTILALSALRAGARVKVVLSGEPGRSCSTAGFRRDERSVLNVLTNYLGTGYAFGIHRLAETFETEERPAGPVHIVVISDQDIFAMLDNPQFGRDGWEVAHAALGAANGGGTYVLHMPGNWKHESVLRMQNEGWDVHRLYVWEELIAFARRFSQQQYEARS